MIGVIVTLESMGLPLPAESLLVVSALYAAQTHHLHIEWIVLAATLGAMTGDNIGYLIGHFWGHSLLERHGHKVGITDKRLLLGKYLAKRYGGWAVLCGRFVALLRIFIALLAGASHMPWHDFLFFNAAGAVLWACVYGFGSYGLGQEITAISGPAGVVLAVLAVLLFITGIVALRRHEQHFMALAEADAQKTLKVRQQRQSRKRTKA
ncbi:DedA family protein [Formicincola oecophyllae]|uniref:DedA family protein n=2 Tax=Formicincola oecophyllae TaxID=2558361 RepID=A0A4Y6UCR6_9PROT|nr:DedA family protein [Formicincola oecophyllae]